MEFENGNLITRNGANRAKGSMFFNPANVGQQTAGVKDLKFFQGETNNVEIENEKNIARTNDRQEQQSQMKDELLKKIGLMQSAKMNALSAIRNVNNEGLLRDGQDKVMALNTQLSNLEYDYFQIINLELSNNFKNTFQL